MSKLALFGGSPMVRALTPYGPIGEEEIAAVVEVMRSGKLSGFLGEWHPDFFGGKQVQAFEREWGEFFSIEHAVSVNSATSGLMTAVGALDIEPGDEIIVSPWTMSASATAVLTWNAIPVFADIEGETFNLDPAAVERCVRERTRAILVTDIFGHPADLDGILSVARRHGLSVIEDCAQAPAARYRDQYAGTVGDIGVFSLNYHKHVHTGEGGVCVTNDDRLADRMRLIRNHGEAVVGPKGVEDIDNIIGFNFRLTELQAAIGREQLKKLEGFVAHRSAGAQELSRQIGGLPGLRLPVVKDGCTHVFYSYPLVCDPDEIGVDRGMLVAALRAEGVPAVEGETNLHLLPVYQKRIAYGTRGFPWTIDDGTDVSYDKGICPVAEDLHDRRYVGVGMTHACDPGELGLIAQAFRKVWNHLDELREGG